MLKSMEPHVVGHKQTIQMFGRFPKRNVALGRESTIQEEQYMEQQKINEKLDRYERLIEFHPGNPRLHQIQYENNELR